MSVYESQTPAERRKRRRRRSEDLLQSWKTLSSFRGRTQSPHYIKVPEDVCVHILVQASSCGPIRVLLSVIWGHFVQASLGQTWDCLFRFKVSIRTGVYSKVWIMDLTKANVCVCVCESALQYMYVRLVSVVTPSSIVHMLLSVHQGFKHTHLSIYHCEAFD